LFIVDQVQTGNIHKIVIENPKGRDCLKYLTLGEDYTEDQSLRNKRGREGVG
jgi:hypothetical protein